MPGFSCESRVTPLDKVICYVIAQKGGDKLANISRIVISYRGQVIYATTQIDTSVYLSFRPPTMA